MRKTKNRRGRKRHAEASKWVAEPKNCEETHISLHGYTWDLISQATTHNQAWTEGKLFSVWNGRGCMRGSKLTPPHPQRLWTFHYHLFVVLNWQKAKESWVLDKTLPGMALCWGTDPFQNPHCYSVMMLRDLLSTAAKPTGGLSGRWVCRVYLCTVSGDCGIVHTR